MRVSETGSVRVDLVGGTIDLEPINLILPNVVTLNVATSLKAEVTVESRDESGLIIDSLDYSKTYEIKQSDLTKENIYQNNFFKEMTFVIQIISYFQIQGGLKISLKSGAPAGSGLGGSSAMGVTIFKALAKYSGQKFSDEKVVNTVKQIEGRILNKGMPGYQDYYPALRGGVLGLIASEDGVQVEQLWSQNLVTFLESHFLLVYSGISRNSGINNWEVYKSFFDKDETVVSGLKDIAKISYSFYKKLKEADFESLVSLIKEEGQIREKLFHSIVPQEVRNVLSGEYHDLAFKMCGAGGGGCFLVERSPGLEQELEKHQMKILDFKIEKPL